MSELREHFSIAETAKILGLPERRVRGWIDEGLAPTREFKGAREHRAERYVDRDGLVTLALMEYLGRHLGERAPLVREIVKSLPADVTAALRDVDFEDGTARESRLSLGDGGQVVIGTALLKALVTRIVGAGLAV
jgi:hypothetical protein